MGFVLDNSVTMRWLFGDGSPDERAYALQVLAAIDGAEVHVPAIWALEVSNVIARAEAKYGPSEARSSEFIHVLQNMGLRPDAQTGLNALGATLQLARRFNLSSYDAAYLELALRTGLPLASLDADLLKAARQAGVARFPSD